MSETAMILEEMRGLRSDVKAEISGLRSDMREDNKELWGAINEQKKCTGQLKVKVEKLNGKHEVLRRDVKHIQASNLKTEEHILDEEKHFNKEKAAQTKLGYLAKKKILAIFLAALAAIVSAGTGLILWWINNIQSGGSP